MRNLIIKQHDEIRENHSDEVDKLFTRMKSCVVKWTGTLAYDREIMREINILINEFYNKVGVTDRIVTDAEMTIGL